MRKQSQKIQMGWPARFSLRNTAKTTPIMRSKKRGMTLVEVMSGSVVLLVVLISALAVVLQSIRTIDEARRLTAASALLQTMVENMRMMPYSSLCTKYLGASDPNIGTIKHTFSAEEIKSERFPEIDVNNYTVTASFNVKEKKGAGKQGLVYADITIAWRTMTGRPISRTYFTIFAEGGVSDSVNRGW
jgi:type II secretory pathway pseudopilin PulG